VRRLRRRHEAEQKPRRPRRDDEPERSADGGEQQALDEQLPDDAAAAGADRETQRHFFLRAVARAMRRLATFAQAMSSTPATMPKSSQSGCVNCRRIGDRPWPAGSRLIVPSGTVRA